MKKFTMFAFVLALGAAAGSGVFAQDAGFNVKNYVGAFGFANGVVDINSDFIMRAPRAERKQPYSDLDGETGIVDSPLEFVLFSYYAQSRVNIRPKEAIDMLPANSKASEVKLAAATAMALAEVRFLDGQNRDRIGRYEGMLQFIKDAAAKAGRPLADSDINAALAAAIGAVVDGEFGKISFLLDNDKYNATLIRNPQDGSFVLSYEGFFNGISTRETKTLSGKTLDDLLTNMRAAKTNNKADFNQSALPAVRTQAALIPAVKYGEVLADIKRTFVNFYNNPQKNYAPLKAAYEMYNYMQWDGKDLEYMYASFQNTLKALSPDLADKLYDDVVRKR
ncbi:MAG: hypothetical protein MdMp014T_0473 [Treponematales bacterium]